MQILTVEEARRRYRASKQYKHGKPTDPAILKKAKKVQLAKQKMVKEQRLELIIQMSDKGYSLEQTARSLGLSEANIRYILRTSIGTGSWPVQAM